MDDRDVLMEKSLEMCWNIGQLRSFYIGRFTEKKLCRLLFMYISNVLYFEFHSICYYS